ncbi:MAG: vacuolar-type H+-ATPase H [Candidatus Saganbacteria bacterium]|uniref:Vacuolar-type H+-ATPase H n=1 Tax=Candidatus Saganbacteria bacterium TaxID=2575572 RepID=A0A833L2L1_UNCSA|nr:MAG: vacuolar-type H+-ATPase H [Candidatus Saganbacteria bacterium]
MEILGLLDTLESMILEGFKIPLTKKVLLNEEQILKIIDKMRLVLQSGDNFAKKSIIDKENKTAEMQITETVIVTNANPSGDVKAEDMVKQAYLLAKEIREGADKYADEVLSNIELSTTRILRTIKAGRERLNKNVQGKTENVEA